MTRGRGIKFVTRFPSCILFLFLPRSESLRQGAKGSQQMAMVMVTLYSRVAYFRGVMQVTLIPPANCEGKTKIKSATSEYGVRSPECRRNFCHFQRILKGGRGKSKCYPCLYSASSSRSASYLFGLLLEIMTTHPVFVRRGVGELIRRVYII